MCKKIMKRKIRENKLKRNKINSRGFIFANWSSEDFSRGFNFANLTKIRENLSENNDYSP